MLEEGADVNAVSDFLDSTPLGNAVATGYPDYLADGWTVNDLKLKQASRLKIVKLLLKQGAEVNYQDDSGMTPIYQAVVDQDLAVVQALLAAGANAKIKNELGYNAIDAIQSTVNRYKNLNLAKASAVAKFRKSQAERIWSLLN